MNGDRERSLDWDQRLATERPGASYMRFSARAAGWWRGTQFWPEALTYKGKGGSPRLSNEMTWSLPIWR